MKSAIIYSIIKGMTPLYISINFTSGGKNPLNKRVRKPPQTLEMRPAKSSPPASQTILALD
ncbi:MAG: hypothetical protein OFPII_22030 [Osedax symbiont Rs1]|nr:MAG: hypothetical protein OFPII_22030 [Osedax symbiont Rs1]